MFVMRLRGIRSSSRITRHVFRFVAFDADDLKEGNVMLYMSTFLFDCIYSSLQMSAFVSWSSGYATICIEGECRLPFHQKTGI